MATNFLWGPVGTVQHLLTTEMNALVTGTLTAAGPEINNSAGYQQGLLYLHLASAAFVAGNFANVYFVPSNDTAGSIYPTVTSLAAWGGNNYFVGTIAINGSTAAQNETLFVPYIPLGKFKTYLATGGSCPTLGATLNTLDLYPTPTQY
jgi:hypothetical protein